MPADGVLPLFRRGYAAVPGELPRIKTGVLSAARKAGWGGEELDRLELVLEEAAVNVIRYAYPGGEGEVGIELRAVEGGLAVRLEDRGVPFDPVAAPPPDLGAPLAQRPVGGLGIHLVRNIADAVTYRREGERNILEIVLMPGHGMK